MKQQKLELTEKSKVRNSKTYVPGKGTKVKGESLTIQDDTLSVAELLLKHINGAEIKGKEGQYADDPNHDDPDVQAYFQMDIAERQDVLEGIREMTKRLKNLEKEWIEEDKKRKEGQKTPSGGVPSGSEAKG